METNLSLEQEARIYEFLGIGALPPVGKDDEFYRSEAVCEFVHVGELGLAENIMQKLGLADYSSRMCIAFAGEALRNGNLKEWETWVKKSLHAVESEMAQDRAENIYTDELHGRIFLRIAEQCHAFTLETRRDELLQQLQSEIDLAATNFLKFETLQVMAELGLREQFKKLVPKLAPMFFGLSVSGGAHSNEIMTELVKRGWELEIFSLIGVAATHDNRENLRYRAMLAAAKAGNLSLWSILARQSDLGAYEVDECFKYISLRDHKGTLEAWLEASHHEGRLGSPADFFSISGWAILKNYARVFHAEESQQISRWITHHSRYLERIDDPIRKKIDQQLALIYAWLGDLGQLKARTGGEVPSRPSMEELIEAAITRRDNALLEFVKSNCSSWSRAGQTLLNLKIELEYQRQGLKDRFDEFLDEAFEVFKTDVGVEKHTLCFWLQTNAPEPKILEKLGQSGVAIDTYELVSLVAGYYADLGDFEKMAGVSFYNMFLKSTDSAKDSLGLSAKAALVARWLKVVRGAG